MFNPLEINNSSDKTQTYIETFLLKISRNSKANAFKISEKSWRNIFSVPCIVIYMAGLNLQPHYSVILWYALFRRGTQQMKRVSAS